MITDIANQLDHNEGGRQKSNIYYITFHFFSFLRYINNSTMEVLTFHSKIYTSFFYYENHSTFFFFANVIPSVIIVQA